MSIDITERKELEEQLMEARDRAQEAARAKSAFLANMSHEIRTPLNGVIGMTSLLDDTDLSGEQQEFVDVVRTSGEALLSIINDILDFSKIEAGKITLESQPFAVHEVVEDALDLVRPKAAEKEIDLAYCVGASAPAALHGDVTRVRQILTNLLSNAVKFTEEGTVNVRVKAAPAAGGENDGENGGENDDGRAVRFAVEDTGIGIPEEQQSELFDSFNQADASTTREYGGTGLGLAISKRLAELMGGTMDVESAAGEGATFHFTIRAEAADLPEPHQQQLFEAQTALDGRRVLVVDDNETNRRMMQLQAERWGMEPVLVAAGAEALRRVRAEQAGRFDVAVLDMHMPEMDGLELARTLADERPGMARLMLSSSGRRRQDEPALDAWLSKPARAERLLRTLRTLVGDGDPDDEAPAPERRQLERDLGERHPLRILLAEDNLVNQKVALRVLGRLGYRADAVADGREVLGAVKRQRYDVVLMDVQMPEMDGKEAARRLCERYPDDDERPRLVAVTANATEDGRAACYRAGMDDHLAKPFEARALADTLRQCTRLPEEPPSPAEDDGGEAGDEAAPPASSGAAAAAAADGEAPPVFDPAYLREQVGDDPAFVEELIGHFLEDAPQQIEAMRAACERADADALEHAAHTLKANARTFGAERLARLCQTLEERGNEGRTDAPTTALVDEAGCAFARVREAVEAHRVSAR
jgi:CheY-like chemotaxis protein/HPt (histidine-containing phosphotransfer) domain-containing protein